MGGNVGEIVQLPVASSQFVIQHLQFGRPSLYFLGHVIGIAQGTSGGSGQHDKQSQQQRIDDDTANQNSYGLITVINFPKGTRTSHVEEPLPTVEVESNLFLEQGIRVVKGLLGEILIVENRAIIRDGYANFPALLGQHPFQELSHDKGRVD